MLQVKRGSRIEVVFAGVCALVALASVAIPLYVIRPFVPQSPHALAFALRLRDLAPVLSALCAAGVLYVAIRGWRAARWPGRTAFVLAVVLGVPLAFLSHVNIFERMFHPNLAPSFGPASQATVDPGDMLLAVTIGEQARAYPIRTMGYHHIINDTVGGQPIAVTYCTLCHTGLVWSRIFDGRTLHFRLAGINNGNALIRDEETSSIWQQSTGECIFGKYAGAHLTLVSSAELSFALWRSEHPGGEVLRPDPTVAADYDPKDWEQHISRTHVVVDVSSSGIDPHEIVFGVRTDGATRAYPLRTLLAAGLIEDNHGPASVLVLVGPDNASIRAFDPKGRTFARAATPGEAAIMTDTETGSTWNFSGCAVSGSLAGQCLAGIDGHKSFWFDWLNHYRDTTYYRG